jgi:tetratricopeptide (TPR) repeat protein
MAAPEIARAAEGAMAQKLATKSGPIQQQECFWKLELARDQRRLSEINLLALKEEFIDLVLKSNSPSSIWGSRVIDLAQTILSESLVQNYKQSLKLSEDLWFLTTDPYIQMFALNWIITNCEDLCDFETRNFWLKRWPQIENWIDIPWAQFLFQFHQAVSFYFSGSMREALNLFEKCYKLAGNIHYHRGQYRSLLHIGLCHFYLRRRNKALEYFQICEKLSSKFNALTMKIRVENEINATQKGLFGTPFKQQILHELLSENTKTAVMIFLVESKKRRHYGLPREAESDLAYLAILMFVKNKTRSFNFVLNKITDLFVVENLIYFLVQNFNKAEPLKIKLRVLHELLDLKGLEIISEGAFYNLNKILGAESGTEIYKFFQILKEFQSTGATKEQICKFVWNLDYDPIIHDSRIYKLVNRAKTAIGNDHVIINMRGSYRLAD